MDDSLKNYLIIVINNKFTYYLFIFIIISELTEMHGCRKSVIYVVWLTPMTNLINFITDETLFLVDNLLNCKSTLKNNV